MINKVYGHSSFVKDQEIANAGKALEEAIKTVATSGEATRGASGPLSSLLIDSDTIICASWLLLFERTMTSLALKGAFNTDEGAAAVRAAQQLKNRIEAACQRVLNNTPPPGVHGVTGEGGITSPSGCPECDDEKEAADRAESQLDRAKLRAARATANTDFAYELAGTQPEAYGQFFLSTPQELEREQEPREADLERAQRIYDTARNAYLDCLEACHKRIREQYGYFERNKKALIATAAAVVATTAFVAGGGGTPTASTATPPPQPVAAPAGPTSTAPVVSTPAPTPVTLMQLIVGRWICAACRTLDDADRHELTLRFCAQLIAAFQLLANSPLRIEHPAPWVTVTGELDEATGTYRATGVGPVSGFSNVSSTVTANFQRNGDSVTAVDLTVTLGENGVFPGRRPVTYSVRLTKTP